MTARRWIRYILVLGLLWVPWGQPLQADTNNVFTQTDWTEGSSANDAAHPANQTGWKKFSSKDTYISTSSPNMFTGASQVMSSTDTTDTHFSGVRDKVDLSGTGTGASLTLQASNDDPFVSNVGQWSNLPEMPTLNNWSSYVKAGNYIYAFWRDNTFAKFDITTEKWTFLTSTPAYFGPGNALAWDGNDLIYAVRGGGSKQFYVYSISGNSWTQKLDVIYNVGWGASMGYYNGFVYLFPGTSSNRFCRYVVSSNTWVTLNNAPYNAGLDSTLVYPGSGTDIYASFGTTAGLARFSTVTLLWTTLTAAPTTNQNMCYPGTGDYFYAWPTSSFAGTLMRYNFVTPGWENISAFGSFPHSAYRGIFYYTGSGTKLKFMSQGNWGRGLDFDPVAKRFDDPSGPKNIYFGYCSWAISDGADDIYVMRGDGTTSQSFGKYTISTNAWTALPNTPWGAYYGTDMVWLNNKIYAQSAYSSNAFAVYDPASPGWTALATLPASVNWGASLATDGTYVYALAGTSSNKFWRYDPVANAWSDPAVADMPATGYQGTAMVYPYTPGGGDYIFAARGNSTKTFYKYQISTDTWTQVADAPYYFAGKGILKWPRQGNFIYAFMGHDYCFAKYDFTTDTWTTLEHAPSEQDMYFTVAAIGDKIYAGNSNGVLFVYTISTATWDIPPRKYDVASPIFGSVVNPDNENIFLMYGNNTSLFFKYSVSQKKFTGLLSAPFLLSRGTKSVYPGSGDYIYVTEGRSSPRFWRYNYVNDTWVQLASAPTDFYGGSQMDASGDIIYAMPGRDVTTVSTNQARTTFLKYTISTDTWTVMPSLPYPIYNSIENGNAMAYIPSENKVYWKASNGTANFYVYNIDTTVWSPLTPMPTPATSGNGQALFYPGSGDFIYILAGNGTNYFYKYSISGNSWTQLANGREGAGYTTYDGDMFYAGDYLYYFNAAVGMNYFQRYSISNNVWEGTQNYPYGYMGYSYTLFERGTDGDTIYGGGYGSFYKYTISTKTWTALRSPFNDLGWYIGSYGAQMIYPGAGDFLYASAASSASNIFASYSVSGNVWATKASPPSNFGYGHRFAATPTNIYALRGDGTKNFWAYNINNNSWTAKADLPATVYFGSSLCYPGKGDWIYAARGNDSTDFYKYSITNNTWTSLAAIPVALYQAGSYTASSLAYPGRGDYLYLLSGSAYNNSAYCNYFFRYSISNNSWEEMPSSPVAIGGVSKLMYPGAGNYLYAHRGQIGYDLVSYRVFKQGSYTSPIKNIGKNQTYNTVTWTDNSQGVLEVKVRTDTSSTLANATSWDNTPTRVKDENLTLSFPSVNSNDTYLQYQVAFIADDLTHVPSLSDLTVNYERYPGVQSLISSAYDTTALRNRIRKLSWSNVLPAGTDVRFQLRTAPDNGGVPGTWTPWLGPAGSQSVPYDFSTDADYVHGPTVEVVSDVGRLKKAYEDYTYTQRIIIDNTAGSAAYDHVGQMIQLDSSNPHFWANVRSDGADVRFVDAFGNNLSYNIAVNGAFFNYATQSAKIFVRIPSVPAGQKISIYLKYGKADAASASDALVSNLPALNNLVAYYRFDEGSGTSIADSSGNSNNGTLYNTPTFTQGITGTAINLNGSNQYMEAIDAASLSNMSAMTLAAWHKPQGASKYHTVISKMNANDTNNYEFDFFFTDSSNKLQGRFYTNATSTSSTTALGDFSGNTWYHGAVTWDNASGDVNYYLNGVLDGTLTGYVRTVADRPGPLRVGRRGDGNYAQGPVDDVAVYNRALSAGEVAFIYNSGSAALPYSFFAVETDTTSPSLSGWAYRSDVVIDNSSGPALTNYQVKVVLGPGLDAFWSRVQDTGADIRFVDADNTTILNHYKHAFDPTGHTGTLYVKLPSIAAGEVRTVYLYYGRQDAASTSSKESTLNRTFGETGPAVNASALSVNGLGAKASAGSSTGLSPTTAVTVEAAVKYAIDAWPSGWSTRKKVTIDNTAGVERIEGTVKFEVPYVAPMKADYTDLRFWDTDHSRKLRYKVVSSDATKALVMVEVPVLPAAANKDIWMYYGNAGAASEQEATLADSVPGNGLMAWWKFNETSGLTAYDSSGNGRNAALVTYSAAPQWVAGQYGNGLFFNTGYAALAPISLGTKKASVAAWVKITNTPLPQHLIGGIAGFVVAENAVAGRIGVDIYRGGAWCDGNYGTTTGFYLDPVALNTWTHVAVTYDSGTAKLYKNGTLVTTKIYADTGNLSDVMSTYGAFGRYASGGYVSNGSVDEVVLYNRALSDTEVANLASGNYQPTLSATFGAPESQSAAVNWLAGFGYRKKITITNAGPLAYDYILNVTVPYDAGKMKADYGDIRFVNTDGRKLSYQIASSDGSQAVFKVKVPALPGTATKDIFMYYGNATAVSESQADPFAVPSYGLLGWWKLDESAGVTAFDSSGNGRTGFLYKDPSWGAARTNNGLTFVSTSLQYMEIPASMKAGLTTFAVSLWVKTTENISNGTYYYRPTIIGDLSSGTASGDFGITTNSGYIGMWGGLASGDKSYLSATKLVNDNNWHHLVATNNGSAVDLYVDGNYEGSMASGLAMDSSALYVGCCNTTTSVAAYCHNVTVDDLLFYNRPLSVAEIKNLYASQVSAFASEETAPAGIDQTVVMKTGDWGLKFTDAGLTAMVNGTALSTTAYDTGLFMHTAMTYDGTALKLYVNGVQKASQVLTGAINTSGNALSMGENMNGAIDEVRVWRTARPAAEILSGQWMYFNGSESGLAACFRFNSATGTTAVDSSIYAGNASLSGAGWLLDPFRYVHTKPAVAYEFDEGGGAVALDASGNGNSLALSNTQWASTGLLGFESGKALDFNGGTSYGSAVNSATLTIAGQITLEAWIKPAVNTGTHVIIAKGNDALLRWNYKLVQVADSVAFIFYNGSIKQHTVASAFIVPSTIYHVVATFDEATDTVKIYINGVLQYTSVSETSGMLVNSDPLYIGREASGASSFSGRMDGVRVYNHVLSPAEVQTNYEQRQWTLVPPPVSIVSAPSVASGGVGAYVIDNPVIQPLRGVFYTNKNMFEFHEISSKPTGTDIKYQISPNGYTWYWWNGMTWASVGAGYSEANLASEVNAHLAAFQDLFPDGDFYYRAYLHAEPSAFKTPALDQVNVAMQTGDTYYIDEDGDDIVNSIMQDGDSDRWVQYKAYLYSDGDTTPLVTSIDLEYITGVLTLTSPNGGETYAVGDPVMVTWTSDGLVTDGGTGLVTLQYSLDGGSTYSTLAAHVANTGSYAWTIPDAPSQEALIRVVSDDLPTIADVSNATFRILTVEITSPNGGEIWEAGVVHHVTWDISGSVPNNTVKLEYSIDGGTNWLTLSAVVPNTGSFPWTVPASFSDNMKVRVVSPSNSRIADISDTSFSIVRPPAFSVLAPPVGGQYPVGSQTNITWRSNSLLFAGTVLLEYSTDDFQADINAIDTVAVGTPLGAGNNSNIEGTYAWALPDRVAASVKVRVSETSVPPGRDTQQAASGVSLGFSIIEPSLAIATPTGSTIWVAGDSQTVTWTSQGIISDDLTLEYTLNGTDYTLIADHLANSGSYEWIVPVEAAGSSVVLRLTDTTRSQVKATSAAFQIFAYPVVRVTYPNGGDTLTMGTTATLAWSSYGKKLAAGGADYNKISLFYSLDNGTSWVLIGFDLPNTGTYNWTVPDFATTQGLFKVVDQSDALIVDTSDAAFSIVLPTVTLTSPVGGESWFATGVYTITWTSVGSISNNLKIEYSTDSGATWTSIRTGQANTGSWVWGSVADVSSTRMRIRITDMSHPTVTSSSAADFTVIPPTVTLTSPNGGETYAVGTLHDIIWTSTGGANGAIRENITIQFSSNNGSSWATVATGESNDGTYSWVVSDNVSANCLIKIFDASRVATTDTSNAVFTVALPSVTLTAPNGGEEWPVGTQKNIQWTSLGSVSDSLKFEYSKDNFTTATTIATGEANDGTYTWTVPDDVSPIVRVRITDAGRPEITDKSDSVFAIVNPILTIDYPNGGELLSVGDVESIAWQAEGTISNDLKIEYSKDSFASDLHVITASTPNTGVYNWTLPDDQSATVKLRITDNARPMVWDKSDANFTILPTPAITLTAPVAGDVWRVGTVHNITWTDNGGRISNNLTLQYSTDNGSTWNVIATGIPNTGTYSWTISDAVSATAKVRIFDANRPATTDNSDTFNLALPKFTLTSPNGGEVWSVGDRGPVTWTSEGTVSENLVLEYSPDNGASWYLIRGGLPNSLSYSWTVPDYVTSQCLLRIKDGNRAEVFDVSDAVFTINPMPTISVTTPSGGEEYVLGGVVPIRWTWTGLSISNITLDYSNDNLTTRRIIANNLSNTGVYDWTIPSDALTGTNMKIRLTDGTRTQIVGISSGYFRIRGGFTLLSPNGGENWVAQSPQTISWQTMGTIPNVKIEYTLDGNNWVFIGAPANAGTYSWTLPNATSSAAKVRISDPDDSTTKDESNASFNMVNATVIFKVLDYDSLQHLQDFSVSEPVTGWADSGQNSPITRTGANAYPYGTYTTFFTKQDFIDTSVTWNPPKSGTSAYNITVYMENSSNAQVSWEAIMTYSFSPANDTLMAVGSLQRKGKLIGTTELERGDLGAAVLKIFEPDGTTVRNELTVSTPATTGMYNFTLTDTNFEGGKVYPATLSITYRDRPYVSVANIDVGSEILQYEFFTQTATNLATSVANIERTVNSTANDIKTEIKGAIESSRAEIKAETTKIRTATETTIPAKLAETQEMVDTAQKSAILNTESSIRVGQKLVVRYRTYSGLNPKVDVYNAANVQQIADGAMTEVGTTGIYEYGVTFFQSWGKGEFTIVCSEATKGSMDAMTITVGNTDMEQVYNQVSSIAGSTATLPNVNNIITGLGTQFSVIETAMNRLSTDVITGVQDALGSTTTMKSLFTQISGVAKQIKQLGGDQGLNFESLYTVSEERQQDMTYLKNKTQELKAGMDLSRKLMENIANKPVTQTWYEYKK